MSVYLDKTLLETIKKYINNNLTIKQIAIKLDIKLNELRNIILEHNIKPNITDEEYVLFNNATLIKENLDNAYYVTDLSEIVKLDTKTTRSICGKYGLKPTKQPSCINCGKQLGQLKGKRLTKFCSRRCMDNYNKPKQLERQQADKTCIICNKKYKGGNNSSYCCNTCRKVAYYIRRSKEWLK